jgi:hypothetical protein
MGEVVHARRIVMRSVPVGSPAYRRSEPFRPPDPPEFAATYVVEAWGEDRGDFTFSFTIIDVMGSGRRVERCPDCPDEFRVGGDLFVLVSPDGAGPRRS